MCLFDPIRVQTTGIDGTTIRVGFQLAKLILDFDRNTSDPPQLGLGVTDSVELPKHSNTEAREISLTSFERIISG